MFDIEYKGGNSVVIATKNLKLVSDPKLSVSWPEGREYKGHGRACYRDKIPC